MSQAGVSENDDCFVSAVDTRNTKYKAKMNDVMTASSNKSYNYKSYMKYMLRRDQKFERIAKREAELEQQR